VTTPRVTTPRVTTGLLATPYSLTAGHSLLTHCWPLLTHSPEQIVDGAADLVGVRVRVRVSVRVRVRARVRARVRVRVRVRLG
jgi:hypothetical protein